MDFYESSLVSQFRGQVQGIPMTLTIELPESVEQAYIEEARKIGVPVDRLVRDILYAHVAEGTGNSSEFAVLSYEQGIPVLRGGGVLPTAVIEETIEAVRRERDVAALGTI